MKTKETYSLCISVLVEQMPDVTLDDVEIDLSYAKGILVGLAIASGYQPLDEGGDALGLGLHLGVDLKALASENELDVELLREALLTEY